MTAMAIPVMELALYLNVLNMMLPDLQNAGEVFLTRKMS